MRLSLLGFFRTKKLEPADKNEDEKTGPIFDPQYIFTNCGAGNGAIFWDRFSNRFLVFFSCDSVCFLPFFSSAEVGAVWAWSNYLERCAEADGRRVLAMNLDESSLPAIFSHLKGNVARAAAARGGAAELTQPVPKGVNRQRFTLVAIICSESALQPLMPQVILAPQTLLQAGTWASLQEGLPDNAYVKHNATGWNSAGVLVEIITILGMTLRPYLHEYQPVLYLDAAPFHLSGAVMAAFAAASIWFGCIPARVTWLLQPCDTHCFLMLKRWLRRAFQERLDAREGERPLAHMIRLTIRAATREVLQAKRWRRAFEQNGLLGGQGNLSSFVRKQVGDLAALPAPARRPDVASLRACWPRNRAIPDGVWAALPPAVSPSLAALPDDAAVLALPLPEAAEQHAPPEEFPGDAPSALAAPSRHEPAAAAAAAPARFRVRSKSSQLPG